MIYVIEKYTEEQIKNAKSKYPELLEDDIRKFRYLTFISDKKDNEFKVIISLCYESGFPKFTFSVLPKAREDKEISMTLYDEEVKKLNTYMQRENKTNKQILVFDSVKENGLIISFQKMENNSLKIKMGNEKINTACFVVLEKEQVEDVRKLIELSLKK